MELHWWGRRLKTRSQKRRAFDLPPAKGTTRTRSDAIQEERPGTWRTDIPAASRRSDESKVSVTAMPRAMRAWTAWEAHSVTILG